MNGLRDVLSAIKDHPPCDYQKAPHIPKSLDQRLAKP